MRASTLNKQRLLSYSTEIFVLIMEKGTDFCEEETTFQTSFRSRISWIWRMYGTSNYCAALYSGTLLSHMTGTFKYYVPAFQGTRTIKYFEEELKDFCNTILLVPCTGLSEKQNPWLTQPELFAVREPMYCCTVG